MKGKHKMFVPFYLAMTAVFIYTAVHQIMIWHRVGMIAMNDFMGIRFLLFGMLKLLDLEGFVKTFMQYDILAKRRKPYGYIFPFLEILLGIAYLRDTQMQYWLTINVVTVLLVGITGIGIWYALRGKKEVDCVCMGTKFPLPMSSINLVENIAMWAMAVIMLFRMSNITLGNNVHAVTDSSTQAVSSTWADCH